VGGAVYFLTGIVSVGTLGLVGVGAGVGYGVGSWIADKYQERQDKNSKHDNVAMDQLPWAMQVSLQSWQSYLGSRAAGSKLTPPQVEQIFHEFAQREPGHAANVSSLVGGASSGGGGGFQQSPGVNVVPTRAAEV
ncbi:unnamed protein product, partial [Polarella glacialis]